jgi:hypothetical protein
MGQNVPALEIAAVVILGVTAFAFFKPASLQGQSRGFRFQEAFADNA